MKILLTFQKLLLLLIFGIFLSNLHVIAQPPNDLIENALNLDDLAEEYTGNSIQFQDATFVGDGTPAPCDIGVAGIWYKFTAAKIGDVSAFIISETNSILVFFEGPPNATSGQELTYVDQSTNQCILNGIPSIETTPGKTYYLFAKNDVETDLQIFVGGAYQLPTNDHIEDATDLNSSPNYTEENIHTSRVKNTDDGGQQNCDTEATPGIWYKFMASSDGEVTATTNFEANEGAVIFYESINPNPGNGAELTWVNQTSNPCGLTNQSSIDAENGKLYYVFVASSKTYIDLSINLSSVLAAPENTIEGFLYYPNPVSEMLTIKANNTIENIQVFNMLGQKVHNQTIETTTGLVNLSHLKAGIYILQVLSEGKKQNFKVFKK